ncbi:hypothetical protein [Sphingobacterium endophyticum]|uniref:hypothetical protein n=1 Tax=Sphingobacterium endophyticum TaxID=2546448 RepID=UPI0012E2AD4F|nr:hypothetical protein [Sphingobacterium endophyticum]
MNKNLDKEYTQDNTSSSEKKDPSAEYLNELQAQALEVSKEEDATFGEKIIREGLQNWPELIDEELRKFKEKITK